MWGFGLDYCAAECASGKRIPSRADRQFNLTVVMHSASLEGVDGGSSILQRQRPFLSVDVGGNLKETDSGEWSAERGQWSFGEAVAVEVSSHDVISIGALCASGLPVIGGMAAPRNVGSARVPVAEVLPRLRANDRGDSGLVHATPVMGVNVTHGGMIVGRVFLSFETKDRVPLLRCAGSTETACTDTANSDWWAGPASWNRAVAVGQNGA